MESRDSSLHLSTAAPLNNKEAPATSGNAGGDEDAIPSVTWTLAKDAALHFQAGRFDKCLEVLHQLASKKEDDPKIFHNIALCEYFRDGCSNPKRLVEALNTVVKKSQELAFLSKETMESVGNKAISGSKGSNASLVYMDEFDLTVASLNIGIIWYHLHDYPKALSVLEPLYQSIEPIDEGIALHVCLLLLDVALACQDAFKSADVLSYLEKAFGVGCASQSDTPQQPVNPSPKPHPASVSDTSADLSSANTLDSSLTRSLSLSDEALEYDESMFSLEMGLVRPSDSVRTKSQPTVDLKLKLQLHKVQFLLLTGNVKQAKREVKLAMNIARGRDSSTALLLKSQLEYARGNYRKSIKLLMASANRTEDGSASMLNNLGCIYYQLGKYSLSSFMFTKSLGGYSSLRKGKSSKRLMLPEDKSLFVFHNNGLQYLLSGKPLLAARCFQKSAILFHDRPVLWLRLSDCCLSALEKGLLKTDKQITELRDIFLRVIGNGKFRYYAIGNGYENFMVLESPLLSLRMARQFIFNGLHLLEMGEAKRDSKTENESEEASSKHAKHNGDAKGACAELIQNSLQIHEELRGNANLKIKQALLANLAFVHLELENPMKALATANSLLVTDGLSKIYRYVGHVYAAEALCLLKKPREAMDLLAGYLTGGGEAMAPFSEEDRQWRGEKTGGDNEDQTSRDGVHAIAFQSSDAALGTLCANFALLEAMQGDFERARVFVSRALDLLPNSRGVTLTAVYVDLKRGETAEAVTKLKLCKRVMYLPSQV